MSLFPKVHIKSANLIKQSILKNGVKVFSLENNKMMSSISFGFRHCGHRFETPETIGFGKVAIGLMFEGSENFSDEQFFNNKFFFETTMDEDYIQCFTQFYREFFPEVVPVFVDGVFNPILNEESVRNAKENVQNFIEECNMNPANVLKSPFTDVLMDKIKLSCFGEHQALGNPSLFLKPENVSEESIREYFRKKVTFENLVVTGTGVDHEEFVEVLEESFNSFNMPDVSNEELNIQNEETVWVGEEYRQEFLGSPIDMGLQNIPALTSMVISVPASDCFHEDTFSWLVLESIFGGGDSFSVGGPGKGMSSLLYDKFLGHYPFYNMQANYEGYDDAGIFSIHASTESQYVGHLFDGLVNSFASLFTEIDEYDVEAAKNRLKSSILRELEISQSLALYVNGDCLRYGEFKMSSEYVKENIDKVTLEDITRIWMETFRHRPAYTCVGEVKNLPKKEDVDHAWFLLKSEFLK